MAKVEFSSLRARLKLERGSVRRPENPDGPGINENGAREKVIFQSLQCRRSTEATAQNVGVCPLKEPGNEGRRGKNGRSVDQQGRTQIYVRLRIQLGGASLNFAGTRTRNIQTVFSDNYDNSLECVRIQSTRHFAGAPGT